MVVGFEVDSDFELCLEVDAGLEAPAAPSVGVSAALFLGEFGLECLEGTLKKDSLLYAVHG